MVWVRQTTATAECLHLDHDPKDCARLLRGDNLAGLDKLLDEGEQVELAYLDPPFFTQRVHKRTRRHRDKLSGKLTRTQAAAFDDRWESLDEYLKALEQRIVRIRQLLTLDGCMVLHVDPTTSHYVKVMCDRIFGRECFSSEIIWRYRRWPAKTPNFQKVHDVLLRYQRDAKEKPRFCQLYEPLAPSTVATWGRAKQLAKVDASGRRVRSSKTKAASPGAPMGDVWEISVIAPVAKERTGYPTQKPRALLQRVVESCSFPGDTVLDAYMGSGTTVDVATRLGRRAIGIDASAEAIDVVTERLQKAELPFSLEGV
jgi:DNA modification methylase